LLKKILWFFTFDFVCRAYKDIVSFLLGKPHIKSIRAWSHKDNKASIAVLLSAGFEESGVDGENIIFTRK